MSSKINGILAFEISDFEQIERLPIQLASCSEAAMEVWNAYWEGGAPIENRAWFISEEPQSAGTACERWAKKTGPHIVGPGGVWLFPGPKCTHVTTIVKWPVAVNRPGLFKVCRDLMITLSAAVSADHFILYRNDGWASQARAQEGRNFDEIRQAMLANGMIGVESLSDIADVAPTNPTRRPFLVESHAAS